jgi:predicted permease
MILQKTNNERVSDSPSDLYAIILAQVVCFINALSGYLIARKAFTKPFEKFVSIVLGSMSFRIMLVGAISWWALAMLNVPQLAYSLSLAVGVFVYLFAEIMYFHVLSDKIKTREKEQHS